MKFAIHVPFSISFWEPLHGIPVLNIYNISQNTWLMIGVRPFHV
ncbi:MAG: hypothetical protein P857_621 [Candidatus Xenolissoclinum pacificiensis L6]|uniref:Uncharacterized protein n=1 Tax=Candidatus Xenolissoclinum pacificiensis L6 TaxID=1401685 RepID=W2UZ38_9RICK|nr:MAG: hypothetical protein P857_621 [Candidatus Xenolissoclinum pacificiensis L6]